MPSKPVEGKPEEIFVNIDYLTGREILEIEELADCPFDWMFSRKEKKGRLLIAAATVVQRRTDPEFTFDEASDRIIRVGYPDETEDPTGPDEPSG